MLTFLTERHICVYKRDIDNALGKYRKYMVGEPELVNGAIKKYGRRVNYGDKRKRH